MKLNKFNIGLYIVILLISCDNKAKEILYKIENQKLVKEVYFRNGQIKFKVELNKDSIPDGTLLKYYQNGTIKKKSHLIDGQLNGRDSSYYDDGSLKEVITWDKGKPIFDKYVYFKNLKVSSLVRKDNGDTVIKSIPRIKNYSFFDYYTNGKIIYERIYNKNGEVVQKEGKIISNIWLESEKAKLHHDFEMIFVVVIPPYTNQELTLYQDNEFLRKFSINYSTHIIEYNFVPTKEKKYNFKLIYKISSTDSIDEIDTVSFALDAFL